MVHSTKVLSDCAYLSSLNLLLTYYQGLEFLNVIKRFLEVAGSVRLTITRQRMDGSRAVLD